MTRKPTAKDLEQYRAVLEHLRRELSGDIHDLEDDAFLNDGVRPSVDNPADIGSDSFAQEFSLELLARDEKTLGQIIEAIKRIGQGSFGRCAVCGNWIPKTRLNAVPHARNCIDCQREAEKAG